MKNSGNEAKKYLKTKHITFLHAANYACFERNSARIARRKEQKQHNFPKRTEASERQGEAEQMTRSRLEGTAPTNQQPSPEG
jgi:hypothetical protein